MVRKGLSFIGRFLSGLVTVILILVLVAVMQQKVTGQVPGFFGYHLMYVLTGSMAPELEAGDAVLVADVDGALLREGDVICYRAEEGELAGQIITHKVVRAPYEEDGRLLLQTQGTANPVPDVPIRTDQVLGKVRTRLRMMGKLYQFFCTVPGLITVLAPIVIMMVMEIRRMVLVVKEDIAESAEEAKQAALKKDPKE